VDKIKDGGSAGPIPLANLGLASEERGGTVAGKSSTEDATLNSGRSFVITLAAARHTPESGLDLKDLHRGFSVLFGTL
jgi:hypothetical protein